MAKLSQFRVNAAAQRDGEWVPAGDEFGDIEIRTRALTDAYFDAQARRLRAAAARLPAPDTGLVDRIPMADRRAINRECLIEHVLLDVRNLAHDDERPVTVAEFADLLRQDDYAELLVACFRAAGQVGQRRAETIQAAAGN